MPRPDLPDWIRNYKPPAGWTNAHSELDPSECRLYGTETLFGDWDARVLILAKDWGPTPWLRTLIARGDPGWRHAERSRGDQAGYKTNEFLVRAAPMLPGGKLYGSATANLLYDDPGWSRGLPGFWSGPLHDHLSQVLRWVLTTMPRVEVVACIGAESWYLTTRVLGHKHASRRFKDHRLDPQPLICKCEGKQIAAFAVKHPARGSNEEKWIGWRAIASYMERE